MSVCDNWGDKEFYLSPCGSDDAIGISAALAATNSRNVVLLPGTYQIKSTITPQSDTRIICTPGVVLHLDLDYSECMIAHSATDAAHTTVNGAHAVGSRDITLVAVSGSGWAIAAGGYLFFNLASGLRMTYRVLSVAGVVVTLDRPIWTALAGGETVTSFTPLHNFHFEGNGARITGGFSGTPIDTRVFEMSNAWGCSVEGLEIELDADIAAMVGWDVGGRHNVCKNIRGIGLGTTSFGIGAVLAVEGQDGMVIEDIESDGCHEVLWFNKSHEVRCKRLSASRATNIFLTSGASLDIHIDGLTMWESGTLAYVSEAGCEIRMSNVSGTLALSSSQAINLLDASTLEIDDANISIAQTTGGILSKLYGATLKLRNVKVAWSGAGWRYGFLTYTGDETIVLENCDLGSYGTNFFNGVGSTRIWMRGRVQYSGTFAIQPMLSRKTITCNGATAVNVPLGGVTAQDICRLTRLTVGGTPGATPMAVVTPAAATVTVPAVTSWTPMNLASFVAGKMVENDGISGHYITSTAGAGFVANGSVLICVRVKAGARHHFCIGTGTIGSAQFDLATPAVGTLTGVGVVGWMVSDGAGGYYCYALIPKMDTSAMVIYMSPADGVLSYDGDNTSDLDVISVTMRMVDYIAVTGIAGDTSQYMLEVA